MGKFTYEAVDSNNKKITALVEAENEKEVRKILRAQGLRVKKITPPSLLEFDFGQWMVEKGIAKSVDNKSMGNFTKQLSVMINAGVPILQSLEILYRTEKNASFKASIKKVAQDVGEGKTIAEAMTGQKCFTKLYCNLVKAGEAGGILDGILKKLALHMEKQEKTKKQVKSAMTYPVIVTFVGVLVIWGMMFFVVPQFMGMLKESNQQVPWITQFVVDISDFVGSYSMIMIPSFFVAILAIVSFVRTPHGKVAFDNMILKAPIFGVIIIKGNLSSFTSTLSTLLSAGVSLIDALDICIETIDNTVIAKDIGEVKKKIIEGKSMTEPLSQIDYFPELVTSMIKVGEQTGQVDQMLMKVAQIFEEEVEEAIGAMTKLIEPLIIVVLGGAVALILVAMYLPIFMSAGGGE